MSDPNGVIYVMTNPSFPDYVKIGYADNVHKRLAELNRSECIPFAFRVYATYEVPKRLTDLSLHHLIDKLNPTLRAIDTFNGKPRRKEFYAMEKEDAYSLLEAIAEIHGREHKLRLWPASDDEKKAEAIAEIIENSSAKKSSPISLKEYLASKNPEQVRRYNMLYKAMERELPAFELHVLHRYIAWRVNGIHFAAIHLQNNQIMCMTKCPVNEYSIGEQIPEHFGRSLNYRTYWKDINAVNELMNIIKESYMTVSGNNGLQLDEIK